LVHLESWTVGTAVVVRAEGEIDMSSRRVWKLHLEAAADSAHPPRLWWST
jgi:hypothetical protein